ncbi:MAG: ATP-binding protein [Opitutaceae bacterium]|jgi:PAS domain S-box-containing protein
MPTFARRRTLLLVWTLVAGAGVAAGWWQATRVRSRLRHELLDDAQRCAVAFYPGELRVLIGTPSDFANPVYLSIKARLARLRQVNPGVRLVCLFRYLPQTGRTILLADSEPPDSKKISNPGDEYAGTTRLPGVRAILRGNLPAIEGPRADASGTWFTGYALIGEQPPGDLTQPEEILALDMAADHWRRDLLVAGLQTAVYAWLLLGLPVGGVLVLRRQFGQSDLIRKLSQAVEQSRSALVITDSGRRIEYASAGLCAITGWHREEMIGQPVRMLASSETTDEQFQAIIDVIRTGRTWQGETINRRKDGSTYPARAIASPVYGGSGRLTHIIAIIEDVTERKQVEAALIYAKERAEAGERAKEQFLTMMGHEIRTPLNSIVGFTRLLFDTALTPEQRECIQTIHDNGESLRQLTSDVLDYSKIDAGRLRLEPQPCNPLECIEFAFEMLAARAAGRHLELLHSVDRGVPAAVLADASRLRQVLINLTGNAIKFTPAGEIEVTAQAEPLPARSWLLTFMVRDTGIGIAPEECGKLFKPFSQIDSSSTRKYGGAGLGLAVSRGLVQMMGGDISVKSEVGRGTTFTFTIVAGEVPVETGLAESPDLPRLQGRTLAIVCASASLRRELGRLAESWGVRVIEYSREQLAAEEWDLAVIDLVPAEAETWQQVLVQRPELSSRPLVALIPVDFPVAERDILRGSFRAFMRKPARHEALRALLAASLQHVAPAAPVSGPLNGFDLRVLLVEDNVANQRLTQKMLEDLGCHWDLAETSTLALARLERGTYDLVLLDLYVPEIDGRAVIEQIRRGEAGVRNQSIWIIALTDDTQESQHLRGMAGGINDCLIKPFKPADLEAALRRSRGSASMRA